MKDGLATETQRAQRKEKPYKAKSLLGAQTRARQLQRQLRVCIRLLDEFDADRNLMARLAADTPQFFNPMEAMDAKNRRDQILSRSASKTK